MNALRKFTSTILVVGSLLAALPASAQITSTISKGLKASAPQEYQTGATNLEQIVGGLIQQALTLVGVLLLVFLIYAGFLWMTAQDSKQVDKAKDILRNALIGLIIIFSAYAIANFVLDRLTAASGSGASQPTQQL